MSSRTGRVDIRRLGSLRRAQLIGILLDFKECPELTFRQPFLEKQPTDRLRLLLMAARLYRALKATAARATQRPKMA
jgi:hypothetical protein